MPTLPIIMIQRYGRAQVSIKAELWLPESEIPTTTAPGEVVVPCDCGEPNSRTEGQPLPVYCDTCRAPLWNPDADADEDD